MGGVAIKWKGEDLILSVLGILLEEDHGYTSMKWVNPFRWVIDETRDWMRIDWRRTHIHPKKSKIIFNSYFPKKSKFNKALLAFHMLSLHFSLLLFLSSHLYPSPFLYLYRSSHFSSLQWFHYQIIIINLLTASSLITWRCLWFASSIMIDHKYWANN